MEHKILKEKGSDQCPDHHIPLITDESGFRRCPACHVRDQLMSPDIEKMRKRLMELILDYAFQYSETPGFKLAHGGTSQFYFNCKRITLDPEGQYLIGNLVFEAVADLRLNAIGGLTLGADPIANATAYSSWLRGRPIQSFIVRKTQKDHGIIAAIEGKVKAGDRVAVVDDVVTTGASTLQAVSACRQAGLDIVGVLALVDRQEMNGRENIEKQVPWFKALVTRDDVMRMYRAGTRRPGDPELR